MTALDTASSLEPTAAGLAQQFLTWLETGVRPDAMFAEDVFADLTVPLWRIQALGADGTFRLREDGHPFPGEIRVEALDLTPRGFLVQFEERWDAEGQGWYCREMIHCAVDNGRISELAIYCTGDWTEAVQQRHADEVRLIRP